MSSLPEKTQNCRVSERRLDELEDGQKEINNKISTMDTKLTENNVQTKMLADSVPKLVDAIAKFEITTNNFSNNITTLTTELGCVKNDVKEIKEKPIKNWEKVKWSIITLLSSGTVLYLISHLDDLAKFLTK